MPRFTFQTDDGPRTVTAHDEQAARAYLAFLTVHPEADATEGDGMTPEQARDAKARMDQAAADLTRTR